MFRKFTHLALIAFAILFPVYGAVSADGPIDGRIARSEVRFLEGMIDHHQMALDMAGDCLMKAVTESVKTLCQNVITAQSKEIAEMRGYLLIWYQIDYVPMSMSHMMHMMGMMDGGMMKDGMMMGGKHAASGGGAAPQPTPTTDHSGHSGHSDAATPAPSSEHSGGSGMSGMGMMPDDPPMMMGMMAGLSKLHGTAYEIAWLEAMIDHHDDALHMAERILKVAEHIELRSLAERIIKDQTAEIEMMEALITELSQ